jgi:Do/DeqQ family serine protease
MNAHLKTFLISAATSISLLVAYHMAFYERQIVELENDFARLVARTESVQLSDDEDYTSSTLPNDFILPASKARKAVVGIKAIQIKGKNWRTEKYSRTNGSGVILSSNGYIVTNYHVVEDADNIEARLDNKREYKCKVVGYDRSTDLALLKIDAEDLSYLELGNSDSLNVGQWVLAIGNPFKLSSSVTAGIVSAKGREINIFDRQGVESFIQTDAAINPGNSGGALINTQGKVIGINTAILTYGGKYEGFSFAIPSSIVRKVVNDIREYGSVQRAWLGIGIEDIDEGIAKKMKLSYVSGVVVTLVEKDGAAKESDIKSSDVIISMAGKPTNTKSDFLEIISQYSPGQEIDIILMRKGKRLVKNITLRNQLNTTDLIGVRKDEILSDLGFELRDLSSNEKDRLSTRGAMVVSIMKDSKIDQTNMEPGFIITTMNGTEVTNVSELIERIKTKDGQIQLKGFYENYPNEYLHEFYK